MHPGPLFITPGHSMSSVGWLRVYARPIRSAPTYYKRGRMWVVVHMHEQLYVAYNQPELKRLLKDYLNGVEMTWYEVNVLDIEDATGVELVEE